MTEKQKEKLLQEVKRLHDRYVLSSQLGPDTFEPGMMEYLDQSDGVIDFETGRISLRFEARGTRYEGRPEIIEKIRIDDPVQIVRDEENRFNPNNFTLLTNTGKNIGNMPAELCNALAPLYDKEELTINSAKVSFVDPLSKRNRHAKRPMIFVLLEGKLIPKPETDIQESLGEDPREPVILSESVLGEKIDIAATEKTEIFQIKSMPEESSKSTIIEKKELTQENDLCETKKEEVGNQIVEYDTEFAADQIKAILDQTQVQYWSMGDNYIFVERDDIPPETLRAIRRSEYVHSVTAVMRFRKVCWRVRIKALINRNASDVETNLPIPGKQEEKGVISLQTSEEEIKKDAEPVCFSDTIKENSNILGIQNILNKKYDDLAGEVSEANITDPVEVDKPVIESSRCIQKEEKVLPLCSDKDNADFSLASVFGVDSKSYLAINIEELHLGVRAANCLSAANCKTIADVLSKSRNDLQNIPFMSTKSLEEIIIKLQGYILSIK